MVSPTDTAPAGDPGVAPACVWRGEFGSEHSLGVVNDGLTGALEAAGRRVERIPPAQLSTALDVVGVAQHWPPGFAAPARGPFVLYQPWEFGRIPERWVDEIRRNVDEVWTPSAYARRAYVESGVPEELVHVVPNGVDLDAFAPEGPRRELPGSGATTFLFVGGTIFRKGIDLLLEAYGRAFTAADAVRLVVKGIGGSTFYRGMTQEQALEAFRARPDAPELVAVADEVPYAEMPALYRAADVLVQPYRGEGFCLPALEAAACGVPAIVTAGGPTDEFLSDACAWRVASHRIPVARGSIERLELVEDGYLLQPELEALVAALRAAADPAARAAKAAEARRHAERFSWTAAGEIAAGRLDALRGRSPVRDVELAAVPGRRRTLFAVLPEWERPETWAPAVRAYASAFGRHDDTTLVLPARDEHAALELVVADLAASGIDPNLLADITLAAADELETVSLELAADAVISSGGRRPLRARAVVPPDPAALRAVAHH